MKDANKEHQNFDDESKRVVSIFRRGLCSERNRKHAIGVLIELKKHLKSLGELDNAMETGNRLSTRVPTEFLVLPYFYNSIEKKVHVFFFSRIFNPIMNYCRYQISLPYP